MVSNDWWCSVCRCFYKEDQIKENYPKDFTCPFGHHCSKDGLKDE